jgi:hypothetical protein
LTRTPRPSRPFSEPSRSLVLSSAASVFPNLPLCPSSAVSPCGPRTVPPLRRRDCITGTANSPPPAVVAAPRGGKEHVESLFPPFFLLCLPVPLVTESPCRLRRGKPQPEPQSATLIAQVNYPCRRRSPELDLVLNGGRTAEIGLSRRGAAAGTSSGEQSPPPASPISPGRWIGSPRPRLDRDPVKS